MLVSASIQNLHGNSSLQVPEHSIDNNNLHGNSSLQMPQHSIDNNNIHGNSSLQVPQHSIDNKRIKGRHMKAESSLLLLKAVCLVEKQHKQIL